MARSESGSFDHRRAAPFCAVLIGSLLLNHTRWYSLPIREEMGKTASYKCPRADVPFRSLGVPPPSSAASRCRVYPLRARRPEAGNLKTAKRPLRKPEISL